MSEIEFDATANLEDLIDDPSKLDALIQAFASCSPKKRSELS